jgi:UDP-N-acetylglucosamine--N-acetylmuramyl-(pentapeptide) pyrophosphoryl-undecaprenol N-acetylglucosamine transferase
MKETGTLKRVLIMAGGTGGHVFPGLALAKLLREKGVDVHWLGTREGLEARLVLDANFPLHFINIQGLRGKGAFKFLFAPIKISLAILQSLYVLKKVKPNVVIGMGGFVSGPGGIASWLVRRPLIIHEQNAKAGTTNQLLARIAKRVLCGFPNAFKPGAKVITIGNPVRTDILHLPSPDKRLCRHSSKFNLLILGGSLGAQAINEIVPAALSLLPDDRRPNLLHQTGEKHFEQTKKAYQSKDISVNLQPFIKDMAEAYAWADMVLCRAGALTVAELCAAGLGAIFVPFPFAVDDHQTANAYFMVKHHAAICIPQAELTETHLANMLKQLIQSKEDCLAMGKAAYSLRRVDATDEIFKICLEVCS